MLPAKIPKNKNKSFAFSKKGDSILYNADALLSKKNLMDNNAPAL
jgi:hypothetical protein